MGDGNRDSQRQRPLSARPANSGKRAVHSVATGGPSIDEDQELVTDDLDSDSSSGFDNVGESSSIGPQSSRQKIAPHSNAPKPRSSCGYSEGDRVVIGARANAHGAQDNSGPVRPLHSRSNTPRSAYATLDRSATHPKMPLGETTLSSGHR
jgi:hypothetical protein